jgi:CO dehydrogenase/acetyl-CoA synthase beta subunit
MLDYIMAIFKAKPFYNVHLGKLVRFNSIGEFETEDQELIEKLSQDENVSIVGKEVKEKVKEEVKEEVKEDVITEQSDDINELRKEYQEKFGKKAFAGWTAEQLKEKIA